MDGMKRCPEHGMGCGYLLLELAKDQFMEQVIM
jgi:hypothetical protein